MILVAGAFLIDYVPLLRFAPAWMYPTLSRFEVWRMARKKMRDAPFDEYLRAAATGGEEGSGECMVGEIIAGKHGLDLKEGDERERGEMEGLARDIAGVVFSGRLIRRPPPGVFFSPHLVSRSGIGHGKLPCFSLDLRASFHPSSPPRLSGR